MSVKLTVHLVRLQSRHQVPVHLNKRLLGLLILVQDQLGRDGTHHLRQLILYHNYLENNPSQSALFLYIANPAAEI